MIQKWKDDMKVMQKCNECNLDGSISFFFQITFVCLIIKSSSIPTFFLVLLRSHACGAVWAIYETAVGWNPIARAVSGVSSGCRQVQVVNTEKVSLSSILPHL